MRDIAAVWRKSNVFQKERKGRVAEKQQVEKQCLKNFQK